MSSCVPRFSGGLAHPLRHPAEAAPPFAVFEGWELGISGAKLLQKDRSIRVQGNEIIYLTLGPWTKPVQILVKPLPLRTSFLAKLLIATQK